MIKKCLGLIVGLLLLNGCSQFALLSSGAGIAMTNNAYVKVYNGIDLATTITTKKDIKTHAYYYVKETIEKTKEVNTYIIKTVGYPVTKIVGYPIALATQKNNLPKKNIDWYNRWYFDESMYRFSN